MALYVSTNIGTSMEKLEKGYPFKADNLRKYGTDLTIMAKEAQLDPVIGRETEVDRVCQILSKRRKNNPCLVGDPGVGKTVIVEEICQRIINSSIPNKLRDKIVFSIDMGRLIAGAANRGEFEQRLTELVDEVVESKGIVILFIDELHTIIGAGAGGGALDASNILKPPLARGHLRCIGATTLGEYRKHIEKDPALERRFQPVSVAEPTVEQTIRILKGLVIKYKHFHGVEYNENALASAARLSHRFISDRFLPDKAIDLMDEAGSLVQLRQELPLTVTVKDIKLVISMWTGIPIDDKEDSNDEDSQKLLALEAILQSSIIGQGEAVSSVARAIRRARAGIADPSRPIASFLFTGPTGVGKTELTKVLALEYFGSKEAIVRVDMSEYMESHSVARFVGSPPGYIGHDEGGQLTEAVRRRPHTILLFDEIEKAHRQVFDSMLQILDDGRLTDGKGRTVDFKNTIIVMTSNIGNILDEGSVVEMLKKHFRLEFLNRVDEVVIFRELTIDDLKNILEIMIREVKDRVLKEKNVSISLSEKLKNKITKEGYSQQYGARSLKRTMVRLVEDKLADGILSGKFKGGDSVTICLGGVEKH